ncbi:toll/interleukin-1 receptor domain-containing protein [Burkholderia multivorans]|nr:toll/interleukin-1 receptor domain-containing protein [Burkholderia multivorans]MBU9236029.1 toll/interleukin-1 receptor domain-containing protein [Burkholderia multivorans]PRE98117.1 toll/interleukin-1 receptor domain-containing protein [Burkholderia multivorans]PRF61401.1 toll/interleukin-1 receptor domain-containing protein [Burkholderia multivorans]QGR94647.1 TIR domain-containing protein [Burkholderia multivorans]HEF4739514.1 toll/interleukin-1 receptor domain-containing protein [Burkh
MERKIFLSHKGVDKPVIRRFKAALEVVGFEPWLDEEAMVAGAELERALLAGFKSSCAAVFFVTPNYVDSGYLASEVNYAIQEKRRKGDRFSIVTLVLADSEGKVGAVPELLTSYVWKSPSTELEAFIEIVKALPLQLGRTVWTK